MVDSRDLNLIFHLLTNLELSKKPKVFNLLLIWKKDIGNDTLKILTKGNKNKDVIKMRFLGNNNSLFLIDRVLLTK